MKNGASKLKKPDSLSQFQNFVGFRNGFRRRRGEYKKTLYNAGIFFVFILYISCASAPKVSLPGEDGGEELSLLPPGARVYFWADAVKGRSLIEAISFDGKSAKDAGQILDNTSSAAAAIFTEGAAHGRRFFLVSSGNYPRLRANFSFGLSRDWKRQKSSTGGNYWFSDVNNIALSLGSNIALVSNMDPLSDFKAEVPPQGYNQFRRSHVMAGWINNPSNYLNNFLDAIGIPLQIPAEDFFFGVTRALGSPELWELVFKIKTGSALQARSLLNLFSFARLFITPGSTAQPAGEGALSMSPQEMAALLFANLPELDGEYLTIRTNGLNESKVALLFEIFSLYSR